jgi:competence protein ComFC
MLKAIFKGLTDIVYPKVCLACRNKIESSAKEELVCLPCRNTIKKSLPPFCHYCGRHLSAKNSAKNVCFSCLKRIPRYDRAFSACVYEGTIKELIRGFKYRNKDYLGNTLGKLMTDFIKEYELPMEIIDFVAPIPLHSARLREREFNQAEVLGEHIAREFNKRILKNNLLRHKPTRTQTGLTQDERLNNVKNSFSLKDSSTIVEKNLVLVDDVLTTGSTASEAAAVLKNAGANIVFVLTLAS